MNFLPTQVVSCRWLKRLSTISCVLLCIIVLSTGAALCQSSPRQSGPAGQESLDLKSAAIEKLIDTGGLPNARAELERARLELGETPALLYLEAKLLFKERQFAESLKQLKRFFQLPAGQFQPDAYKLAGLNYVMLDRLDLAEPLLKQSTERAPDDYLTHFHLGTLYYLTSRFSAAEAEFRQTVKLRPAFAKGHDSLGLALEELGEAGAAIQAHRKAIQLAEEQKLKDSSAYLNLGKFLLAKNRLGESLPLLQKAAQLSPNSAEAFFLVGKAASKSGNEAEALKALAESIRLDPGYAESHYWLSRIYLRQGLAEQARKELEVFQELKNKKMER